MNASNAREYLPLVKALAEGKVLQGKMQNGRWKEIKDVDFLRPAKEYRVKPEAEEFWANRYPDRTLGTHLYRSRLDAKKCAPKNCEQICYREVME